MTADIYCDQGDGPKWVATVVREDIADIIARFLSSQSGFPTEVRNT